MSSSGGGFPTEIEWVSTELRMPKCRNHSVIGQCPLVAATLYRPDQANSTAPTTPAIIRIANPTAIFFIPPPIPSPLPLSFIQGETPRRRKGSRRNGRRPPPQGTIALGPRTSFRLSF